MPTVRSHHPNELFAAAREGDHASLARLLSLIERGGAASRAVAAIAYGSGRTAYTVGLTGAPGAPDEPAPGAAIPDRGAHARPGGGAVDQSD
jgi:LAO/AO transport system kinase